MSFQPIDTRSVNTIRTLSIDAVQKANSGHPGLPLGAAPMAYVLWQRHLIHNPKNPSWPNRDRFVLSPGHGSMLLYSMLHLYGYALPMSEVQSFRQWGALTPGHPEAHLTPGVEATTGPLGQGTANAVGMAIAERSLAARYNTATHTIVDHHTFAIVSDGDLMEGISSEAASLAGHLGLGKLIYLYDDNKISLDGPTSLTFTEDVGKRYEAYGWQVLKVGDGDTDLAGIDAAITAAKADTTRPSIILIRTTIGYGSPKANSSGAHGSPLGKDGVAATKKALGFDPEKFFDVPADAGIHMLASAGRGESAQAAWQKTFDAWAAANPALAAEWTMALENKLPANWANVLPKYTAADKPATRASAGAALNAAAKVIPWIIGGDADLSGSTNTSLKDGGSFNGKTGQGRNIHYGVREHAMGAIANGIAYHGGLRTFTATFFAFSDYERPALRIAALNNLPVVFVFTHDSVALGEDGPTHQPVEHLAALRAMPDLWVVRPADGNEASQAWRLALERNHGPTVIIASRQNAPTLDPERCASAEGLARGAYILSDAKDGEPQAIIIATGTEVGLALKAQDDLKQKGIPTRVVSMPCWEAFEAQPSEYQDLVLPPAITARVSVEAGVTFGWERWVGRRGIPLGIDRYGASAPGELLMEKLGMTAERVAAAVIDLVG
jgi:transketolase